MCVFVFKMYEQIFAIKLTAEQLAKTLDTTGYFQMNIKSALC